MRRHCTARPSDTVVTVIAGTIIVLTLATALSLPILSHQRYVAVGVWIAILGAFRLNRAKLRLSGRHPSLVECVPGILIIQYDVDRLVPSLGSALVLFGYLALITECVRGSWFPYATLRNRARSTISQMLR